MIKPICLILIVNLRLSLFVKINKKFMKNMNKRQRKSVIILSDQNSHWEQQKNKENQEIVSNAAQSQRFRERRESFRKKLHSQMPFVERFKDKLFVFNKLGNIQKLQRLQGISMNVNNVLNIIKQTKHSLTKPYNRKNFMQINKIKISSRHSLSTKQTTRKTNSLDVSKVSSVSVGQKHRYACQNFQIKEQECEETIIKAAKGKERVMKLSPVRLDSGDGRKVFLSDSAIKHRQDERHKKSVRRFFVDPNSQNTSESSPITVHFGPQCISLENSRNTAIGQQQLHRFPQLKNRIKEYRMSKRHSTKVQKQISPIFKSRVLPQIELSNNKVASEGLKQRLLTIR